MPDKPPYRVPSMAEIRAVEPNGFTAVSTFSGGGGSSLGYRMAGFTVAWASEFIPAAADTYRANASGGTVLDTRDIREVTGEEILAAAGGRIDLFDGSPPCASFSTAGKREAGWGKVRKYSDTRQRTDDLFFEYARLIGETQPLTFVAENVAGLVKGTAKGYFKLILARLKECGYRVEARLLNAAWLGVPQSRPRLIFIGVRDDLDAEPVFPRPLPYRYTIRDALPDIIGGGGARLVHDTSGERGSGDVTDRPSPAITIGVGAVNSRHFQVHAPGGDLTHDPETGEKIHIGQYAIGRERHNTPPGGGSARYLNLKHTSLDRPSQTITADGGDVTKASVTHWAQARKLTLAELRRIGGFPDDFVLTGTYAQRWERIGRAVPPVMMSHIAAAVRDGILVPLRQAGRI